VDENKATAMKYQIMSIPMQKFFYNGKEVDEILGAVPERTIRAKVEDILTKLVEDAGASAGRGQAKVGRAEEGE
jgi:thioredoxin-like negative regulator of GroEL